MSFGPIQRLVEREVDRPATTVHDPYLHGLLIARHGKLVFEDYFYGYDRATPHDTRSASKSITAALVGAAIESGAELSLSDSVYEAVYGGIAEGLDPRKARMTVEHLLTMSSGYDCDDRDSASPGAEDTMWEQEDEPDFYKFTLALPMAREPGESAVYCSINPNLIGAVLESATGEWGADLLHRMLAEPLGIERYHQNLTPTGQVYMGGGIQWLPRDFMKLGQLFLNGGVWQGRRILGSEFVERATSPLVEMRGREYGYLWWRIDYPYRGREVAAFFAGGNGGQLVMGIPELDLLVATFGGNYSDRTGLRIQEEFVPDYILPAVEP
jgi:CubicO group peptidase (beta-lactamase class C family)